LRAHSEQSLRLDQAFLGNAAAGAAMLGFHGKEIRVIGRQIRWRLSPDERTLGLRDGALVAGEGGGNFFRDLALDFEQVRRGPVIAIGPNVAAGSGVDELRRHSDLVVNRLNATFEHVADAEIAADGSYVRGLASVNFS
jgi:hypothetical protein